MNDDATNFTNRFDELDDWRENVDGRFGDLDNWRKKADGRFEKIDKQLDKIATIIVKGFDRIEKALDKKADKTDLDRALGLLDSIAKQQETDEQERLAMGHQIERVEGWSHELADKMGHKLSSA